jgi:hypothetical protein
MNYKRRLKNEKRNAKHIRAHGANAMPVGPVLYSASEPPDPYTIP